MKLTDKSIAVLSGFANINTGIWLIPGKHQTTVDQFENSMFAAADLEEDFPCEFGIINLGMFLSNVSNFTNAEISFVDGGKYGHIMISDADYSMVYHGVDRQMIKTAPSDAKIPFKSEYDFKLSAGVLDKARKFAAINKLPHITLAGTRDGVFVRVTKANAKEYDPATTVESRVGEYFGKDFSLVFRTNYFNGLVTTNYNVGVMFNGLGRFETEDKTVEYFIMHDALREV